MQLSPSNTLCGSLPQEKPKLNGITVSRVLLLYSPDRPSHRGDLMIRHTACTSLFVAVLALTAPSLALAADPAGKARVVFQVSDADPAKWNLALNNIKLVRKKWKMYSVGCMIIWNFGVKIYKNKIKQLSSFEMVMLIFQWWPIKKLTCQLH
jgi:hypothetical protein